MNLRFRFTFKATWPFFTRVTSNKAIWPYGLKTHYCLLIHYLFSLNIYHGEVKAVIAALVDWKQNFPRQCPKLGVEAFFSMGIRPSLIPMLINYFQNRKIKVKWKGVYSQEKKMPGGGPALKEQHLVSQNI